MSAIPPPPPHELPPWEAIPTRAKAFDDLGIRAQRDELLSAVGLLVDFAKRLSASGNASYPLMNEAIDEMGRRYGPWAR